MTAQQWADRICKEGGCINAPNPVEEIVKQIQRESYNEGYKEGCEDIELARENFDRMSELFDLQLEENRRLKSVCVMTSDQVIISRQDLEYLKDMGGRAV